MKFTSSLMCLLFGALKLIASDSAAFTWEYDDHQRLSTFTEFSDLPQRRITSFFYDDQTRISKVIKPDGVILTHEMDERGRLVRLYSSDGSISYQYLYDDFGNVASIQDLIHKTSTLYKYNKQGELLSHSQENGLQIKYDHQPEFNLFHIILPDRSKITYHYLGDIALSITRKSKDGQILYTHYLKNGDRPETFPGLAGTLSVDQDEKEFKISNEYWKEWIPMDAFDSENQIQCSLLEDPLGMLETHYGYDQQQLVSWNNTLGETCEYRYDALGNRLDDGKCKYQVDSLNQTISKDHIHFTYDLNGNLISRSDEEGVTLFYYDPLDRMIEVVKEGCYRIEYTYDGYHRRQTKSLFAFDPKSSTWIRTRILKYLHIGSEEIGCVDEEGKMIELRILCAGFLGEVGSTKIIEISSGTYGVVHDHQGNIRCLIDTDSGKVKEFYRYSPFGEEQIFNSSQVEIDSKLSINPWRFSSKRTDPETGFVWFGKRDYSPEIGKWTTPDPIGFPDGANRYVYVKNNPIQRTDAYGYFSTPIFIGKLASMVRSFYEVFHQYSIKHHSTESFDLHMGECMKFFVGKGLFSLSNYISEPPVTSSLRGTFPSKKRRITFINGIMNSKADMDRIVEKISEWHEHPQEDVYFVYRGTGGWTRDIIKCLFVKIGYVSDHAESLANTWKQLISEMGGPNEGGEIIHWAHSIGGTETLRARNLLTPEEQKMIKVISLGSATVIPDVGFQKVINHMSYRDGVCYLDPIGFLHALICKPLHVDFKGSFLDGYPFVDHIFGVYWKYLREVLENEN